MDTRELSPGVLQMMLAMTVPMQHLLWYTDGHGGVHPVPLKVPLPGKRFDRLDPGYGGHDAPDNEICQRIMVPTGDGWQRLQFTPGMLARLEHERLRKR